MDANRNNQGLSAKLDPINLTVQVESGYYISAFSWTRQERMEDKSLFLPWSIIA